MYYSGMVTGLKGNIKATLFIYNLCIYRENNLYERQPASAETFGFEDVVLNCIKHIWSLDENTGMLLFKYSDWRK